MNPDSAEILQSGGCNELTALLSRWNQGESALLQRIFPLVYDELRRIAARRMRSESPDHLIQPTALVNEAYLKLAEAGHGDWKDRVHFFAAAAKMMRYILVDYARRERAQKRGGFAGKVTVDERLAQQGPLSIDILAVDESLTKLGRLDERKARVIELRYFAGLEVKEIAGLLDLSVETVMRDLRLAKVWLKRELERAPAQ